MEEVAKTDAMPALYAALAEFQKDLKPMKRTATVTVKMNNGGTYEFKYTPLDEIMGNVYEALGKQGLSVRHELVDGGIEAVLSHKNGGELRSGAIQVARTGDMKNIGAQITYARRYSITMLLGIASDEDTDAGDLNVPDKKTTAKDAAQNIDITEHVEKLESSTSLAQLKRNWTALPLQAKENLELQAKKEELKTIFEQEAAEAEDQTPPEEEDKATPPD